ncbi:MAG: phenylalanine--tRNA ligase subunit beta [Candidatus Nitrosothermus koennekii]|nr:MAG: phenylalanine--tRNA ligase subunit beta [Candidatus Nitrosothermus koennekii]
MPVVTLYHNRLKSMLNLSMQKILDVLPYIALDIEEQGKDYLKVEYNPNRPDFSTDYGIVRALKGLLSIEEGLANYKQYNSNLTVKVHKSVKGVRPYLVSMLALDGKLDEETIRQIITMQEDLHDGIGRKRRKVSIGIHDYDKTRGPFIYTLEDPSTRFIPLNEYEEYSLEEVLNKHELGIKYGYIINNKYPVIKDADDNIISFPPIINAEQTRVDEHTKNLFIEITATDLKAAEDALSILAITLFDAGFKIKSVNIYYGNKRIKTPNMTTSIMDVDISYINRLLGLSLTKDEIIRCLRKSRLDAKASRNVIRCIIPRYRFDIINAIDIVEEVAIGYGIYNLEATYPLHKASGNKDALLKFLDNAREVMIGLNAIENFNFDLIDKDILNLLGMNYRYEVEHSKSKEHEVLRPSLIPSLLKTLSINIHESYPQLLFEIGKAFEDEEEYRLAFVLASKDANYTNVKSYLQAFLRALIGRDAITPASIHPVLKEDASASIMLNDRIGVIGEVKEDIINALKIRVNVSLFELSLDKLYEMLHS